jgi:hypothetical protein
LAGIKPREFVAIDRKLKRWRIAGAENIGFLELCNENLGPGWPGLRVFVGTGVYQAMALPMEKP